MGISVKRIERKLTLLSSIKSRLIKKKKQLQVNRVDCERHIQAWQESLSIMEQTVLSAQNQAHLKIASVVSVCLQLVFEDPYEFRIVFAAKRNQTEATIQLTRNGLEIEDPLNSMSGGVLDVVSFSLRLACLLFTNPPLSKVIVLDEPFKFLHPPERRPRIVGMLEYLADKFEVQFVLVTGLEELRFGKVIDLNKKPKKKSKS
jgi:ABC-type Mn2+/Zn2+ transport system ATPase subunit